MKKSNPRKGRQTKDEPIRKKKDINAIKKILHDKPLEYAFFTIGINTNLRASDLLQLKVGTVRHLEHGDDFSMKEIKPGNTEMLYGMKLVLMLSKNFLKGVYESSRIYRVSSARPASEGESLHTQRESLKRYCKANEWELTEIYADEGISGKSTDDRPGIAKS